MTAGLTAAGFFRSQLGRLASGAGLGLLVRVLGQAIALIAGVVIARSAGVTAFGVYSSVLALANVAGLVARFGTDIAIVRFGAAYSVSGSHGLFAGLLRFSTIVCTALGILCAAVVVFIGASWGDGDRPIDAKDAALYAALSVPFLGLLAANGAAVRARMHVVIGQLADQLVRPGVLLLFVLILGIGADAVKSAGSLVACNTGAVIAAWLVSLALRRVYAATDARNRKYEWRSWVTSTFPIFLVASATTITNQADVVMIGLLHSADEAGLYSAASRLSGPIGLGLVAVNLSLAPMISARYAEGKLQDIARLAVAAARMSVALAAVGVIVLFAAGEFLLGLFGSEFVASYSILLVLLLSNLINATFGSVGYVMNMTNQQVSAAAIMSTAAGANILLNYFAIPRYGALGAAITTVVVTTVWNFSMWLLIRRRLGVQTAAWGRMP